MIKKVVAAAAVTGGLVLASAGVAAAQAGAQGASLGSPGAVSGNVIQAPVGAEPNVCGNSAAVVGLLPSVSAGNACTGN
ncbi:hypothetical protein GCM10018793_18240 [Streptomyces sulfonofaciens]|uniref:Chaplin domain-containing protein n=1 Tax=Streptomyces sulfonofaciens TaxID=68272 RepID=A0A919G175_9ACTN|nr:chaplin [Streptomyces sulfonofaciens]GHH75285.1 hypothetical protein GCM10018793_18240 [Streptomyces sulfonofaciens]